jgi:hypothetical protein
MKADYPQISQIQDESRLSTDCADFKFYQDNLATPLKKGSKMFLYGRKKERINTVFLLGPSNYQGKL